MSESDKGRKPRQRRQTDERSGRKPPRQPEMDRHPADIERQAGVADAPQERLAKISGLAAVTALFRRSPERAIRLYYSDAMKLAAGPFCARMAEMRRVYRLVTDEELERIAGTVHHGGIVAAAQPITVSAFDSDTAERWATAGMPLVVLDGVGNPHNLGAIARTAAFFGVPRLLLSGHQAQAGLSDAAYRVAEGGLEHLEIYATPNLPLALKELQESYRVVGTALRGGRPFGALPADPRPMCLVLGNEEEGLPPATLRACESLLTIRGGGAVQSLNVSASAAILISQMAFLAGLGRRPPRETTAKRRSRPSPKR